MIKKLLLSASISTVLLINTVLATSSNVDIIKQSDHALSSGKIYLAQNFLKKAEQSTENSSERWLISIALADTLIRSGQIDAADSKLHSIYSEIKESNVLKNRVLISDIQQRFGHIAVARNDHNQAVNWYQQAVNSAKQTKDNAQIANALINLGSIQKDSALLRQAATNIATLNNSEVKHQLRLSLGYQAVQLGEIKLAHQSLQSVLEQSNNRRFKAQALGYQAELYAQQQRIDEAVQLIEQALLTDSSPDLQLDWHWKRARLLATQSKDSEALSSYRHAIQQLQGSRIDIPIVYQNGESSFNKTFSPLYSEYIDLLLQKSNRVDNSKQQKLLEEVLQTWEQLKVVELKDYFRNSCLVEQHKHNQIEEKTAVLYPMMLSNKMALVVRFSDHIKSYFISQTSSEILTSVNKINKVIQNALNEPYILKSIDKEAKALYQWLIAPISIDLQQKNIETLVYLPDGGLRKIPFSLLYDGEQYLTEKYTLVTTASLSLLATKTENIDKKDILLAGMSELGPVVEELLNSLKEPEDDKVGLYTAEPQRKLDVAERTLRANQLKEKYALPNVTEELKILSTLSTATVMENTDFLLDRFVNNVHQGHSIIHIASHGSFSGDPEKSFIMTYDHLLNMNQLTKLFQNEAVNNKPIELVTLSACQTAQGDDRSPLGLSGVVVQTGVKSAIGTLWPVVDEAAKQFFTDFYKFYQQPNTTKAQAMQKAQHGLMKNKDLNHPFYWAPFVLVGEWH